MVSRYRLKRVGAGPGQAIFACDNLLAEEIEVVSAGEYDKLYRQLNTPEVDDFLEGVKLEAAHQRERWTTAHDREKSAEYWFWLIAYLSGKALRAALTFDYDKARHHCISSAAALYHWQTAITGHKLADDDLAQRDQPPR